MPEVTHYGLCSVCHGGIVEARQVGCEKADNFRGSVCDVLEVAGKL